MGGICNGSSSDNVQQASNERPSLEHQSPDDVDTADTESNQTIPFDPAVSELKPKDDKNAAGRKTSALSIGGSAIDDTHPPSQNTVFVTVKGLSVGELPPKTDSEEEVVPSVPSGNVVISPNEDSEEERTVVGTAKTSMGGETFDVAFETPRTKKRFPETASERDRNPPNEKTLANYAPNPLESDRKDQEFGSTPSSTPPPPEDPPKPILNPGLLAAIKASPRLMPSPRDANNKRPSAPPELLEIKSDKQKFARFESNLHAINEFASQGDLGTMQELLDEGTAINCRIGENGETPLTCAANFDKPEAVKFLLEHNANIDEKNFNGCTPLYIAAEMGSIECMKILIQYKARVNAPQDQGATPLFVAAEAGNFECIKLLLQHKAKINKQDEEGLTPLHGCVQEGFPDAVKFLIDHKANVNVQDSQGFAPIHIAAQEGSIELLETLIENNADTNLVDNEGCNITWHACSQGHVDCLELFIDKEVDISLANNEGLTPIYLAAESGFDECLKLLIANGAKGIDDVLSDCWTPLLISIYNSNPGCVKQLIKAKADVNQQFEETGSSPSFVACQIGTDECKQALKLLIKAKADINLPDNEGTTPAGVACENGNANCLKLLMKHRADVTKADNDGITPFDLAEDNEHEECLRILAKRNQGPDEKMLLYE